MNCNTKLVIYTGGLLKKEEKMTLSRKSIDTFAPAAPHTPSAPHTPRERRERHHAHALARHVRRESRRDGDGDDE